LRGIQAGLRTSSPARQSALKVAAVVCLVLLVLLAVIQVMHVHASESDADHCPLCVALHSVAPFVIMLIAVVLLRIGIPTPEISEFRAITRYWHPTLFTRPPPLAFSASSSLIFNLIRSACCLPGIRQTQFSISQAGLDADRFPKDAAIPPAAGLLAVFGIFQEERSSQILIGRSHYVSCKNGRNTCFPDGTTFYLLPGIMTVRS